jgi:hypothetical protein
MWRQKEKPKTVRVSRQIAEQFSKMDPPHDRPLNERRMMVYERFMKDGSFRPVTWATCFCIETGQEYRVNGHHTSTLLARLDPIPEFYAVIESYEADTLDDVAKLWATFDSRICVRTNSDINGSFAATVDELKEFPTRFINLIVTALSFHKWGDQYGATPAPERAELILDSVEFALWVSSVLGHRDGKSVRFLYRGPVVAAMYATWLKSHKAATDFWCAVRDETGDNPNRPDRRLAKWLGQMNVDSGQGAASARRARRAKQREFYVKCLHAWNAWRRGETTDLKYYPSAKVPSAS